MVLNMRMPAYFCGQGDTMLLNAVMCVWNEEDIIESTVKHAFAQGCSNVFIIDNASTDKTIEIALNSGAILADTFESKYFDEIQKVSHLNSVVKAYNDHESECCIWWLYIDADEFPNIDYEYRIIDFIKSLDSSVRLIHGYLFDHIPTHLPYNIPGYHPADFMPVATKTKIAKIPLVRYDKGKQHLYSCSGAHTVDSAGESIPMIKDVLNIHHFHYRRPEDSIARLKLLLKKNHDGSSRIDWMDAREQNLQKSATVKSTYHNRYNNAKHWYNQNKYLSLRHDNLPYTYKNITRWYDTLMSTYDSHDYDTLLNKAIQYFFLADYDLALCKFYDALQLCKNDKIKLLIYSKVAYCLAKSNKDEAMSILTQVSKCKFPDIKIYAENLIDDICKDHNIKLYKHDHDNALTFEIVNYFKTCGNKIFV
jgi:glycosyltransferase involved in cell wall biosynthesis